MKPGSEVTLIVCCVLPVVCTVSSGFWIPSCSWRGPRQVAHRHAPRLQPGLAALQSPAPRLAVQRQQVPLAALQPEQEGGAHRQHEPRAPLALRAVGDGRAARAPVARRPPIAASGDAPFPRPAGPGGGLSGGGEGEPPSVRRHPLGGPSSRPAGASGGAGAGKGRCSGPALTLGSAASDPACSTSLVHELDVTMFVFLPLVYLIRDRRHETRLKTQDYTYTMFIQ